MILENAKVTLESMYTTSCLYSIISHSPLLYQLFHHCHQLLSRKHSKISHGANSVHVGHVVTANRTFLSIVGGVIAGVLGLTGISGFLCYFLIIILASGGIAAKTKFDVHSYFDSWSHVLFDGIGQGIPIFYSILDKFAYDIVHIF